VRKRINLRGYVMSGNGSTQLTDPGFCLQKAAELLIPVTDENWGLVQEDASDLNILQAAATHLVYVDTERTEFQEKLLEIVFTAYLMGRTADERHKMPDLAYFREFIEGLDLSGL
jgi:hypothetical protein